MTTRRDRLLRIGGLIVIAAVLLAACSPAGADGTECFSREQTYRAAIPGGDRGPLPPFADPTPAGSFADRPIETIKQAATGIDNQTRQWHFDLGRRRAVWEETFDAVASTPRPRHTIIEPGLVVTGNERGLDVRAVAWFENETSVRVWVCVEARGNAPAGSTSRLVVFESAEDQLNIERSAIPISLVLQDVPPAVPAAIILVGAMAGAVIGLYKSWRDASSAERSVHRRGRVWAGGKTLSFQAVEFWLAGIFAIGVAAAVFWRRYLNVDDFVGGSSVNLGLLVLGVTSAISVVAVASSVVKNFHPDDDFAPDTVALLRPPTANELDAEDADGRASSNGESNLKTDLKLVRIVAPTKFGPNAKAASYKIEHLDDSHAIELVEVGRLKRR